MDKTIRNRILWVDDMRNPEHYANLIDDPGCEVVWLKSYDDFVDYMAGHKLTKIKSIWFDHDLGDGKSGYDAVKYFIDNYIIPYNHLHNTTFLPNINSQSSNPPGRENILGYVESYERSLRMSYYASIYSYNHEI